MINLLAFVDTTPESTTAAEWVQIICDSIDLSVKLGVKVYPVLWALFIVRRILTA